MMGVTPDQVGAAQGPMAPPDAPTTRRAVALVLLSHGSTRVILASGTALAITRFVLGRPSAADAWAVVAVAIAWPAFEWALHIALHVPPIRIVGVRVDPPLCRRHRRHHVQPGVVDDLLLPPAFLAALAVLAWTLPPLLFGLRTGLSAALAFHAGGLANGWVHLLTHSRVRPWSRYYAWVRRNHHLHHFKDPRRWFAFTGPWMDSLRRR
jgi:hypothetical protein